jgi:hypothetical protein
MTHGYASGLVTGGLEGPKPLRQLHLSDLRCLWKVGDGGLHKVAVGGKDAAALSKAALAVARALRVKEPAGAGSQEPAGARRRLDGCRPADLKGRVCLVEGAGLEGAQEAGVMEVACVKYYLRSRPVGRFLSDPFGAPSPLLQPPSPSLTRAQMRIRMGPRIPLAHP